MKETDLRVEIERQNQMLRVMHGKILHLTGMTDVLLRLMPILISERHMSETEACEMIQREVAKSSDETISEAAATFRKIFEREEPTP